MDLCSEKWININECIVKRKANGRIYILECSAKIDLDCKCVLHLEGKK